MKTLLFIVTTIICLSCHAGEEDCLEYLARQKTDALGYVSFSLMSDEGLERLGYTIGHTGDSAETPCDGRLVTGLKAELVAPGFYSNHPRETFVPLSGETEAALRLLSLSAQTNSSVATLNMKYFELSEFINSVAMHLKTNMHCVGNMPRGRLITVGIFQPLRSVNIVDLLGAACMLAPLEISHHEDGQYTVSFRGEVAWDKMILSETMNDKDMPLPKVVWYQKKLE